MTKKDKIKKVLKDILKVLLIIITCWFTFSFVNGCIKDKTSLTTHAQVKVNNDNSYTINSDYTYFYNVNNDDLLMSKYYSSPSTWFNFTLRNLQLTFYFKMSYADDTISYSIYSVNISGTIRLYYAQNPTTPVSYKDFSLSVNDLDYSFTAGTPLYLNYSLYQSGTNWNITFTKISGPSSYYDLDITKTAYLSYAGPPNYSTYYTNEQPYYINSFDFDKYIRNLDYFTKDQQLYNEGIAEGKRTVLNNISDYDLYNENQYLSYGLNKYTEGYNTAADEITPDLATNGFRTLMGSILNSPYNILHGMLNFEIFGVNLFDLLSFIFTSVLIIAIIKLFI